MQKNSKNFQKTGSSFSVRVLCVLLFADIFIHRNPICGAFRFHFLHFLQSSQTSGENFLVLSLRGNRMRTGRSIYIFLFFKTIEGSPSHSLLRHCSLQEPINQLKNKDCDIKQMPLHKGNWHSSNRCQDKTLFDVALPWNDGENIGHPCSSRPSLRSFSLFSLDSPIMFAFDFSVSPVTTSWDACA